MSKGQTKKTREAAGNRRKLTRAEKKQIAAVIRQAKGDGKAHTAQQTIPYLAMYPDGICKVAQRKYSKSIAFEDINYQLAQADDKTAIFENWCDFLNYFDASVNVQLSFINQGSQQEQAARAIHIPPQNDDFNSIRTEYSDMLKMQLAKGNNGLVKHKYITFSIEADNPAAARARLSRIETDVLNNFKVLGVSAHPLSGYERLKVLHGVFHPAGEPFSFSYDWLTPTGLTTKDFIAPSSFKFGEGRYFAMGKKTGAVSFLEILAPELNDRILADMLDLETGVIVNLHIKSIDQSEAIKTIKRKITDLDNIIADWIPVLESNHFEYEFVIPETEYFIHIDVNAYTRVLNNLFQNIIIHSAGDKMALHICEDIQQAKIIISDNGKEVTFSDMTLDEARQLHTFDEYFKRETAETVFEKAGKKITPKLLLEAIRTLPEEKRKAILLYYFEGMSDTEIAELLNTPRSTIQYRRTSSFEQLRKYLEENADEWDEW